MLSTFGIWMKHELVANVLSNWFQVKKVLLCVTVTMLMMIVREVLAETYCGY